MALPAWKERYTFADVLTWEENERIEIIGGEAVMMAPSTQHHDRLVKLELYQRAGVREYWIVSPEEQAVQVFTLSNGLLLPHEVYGRESVAKVNVLDGCFIELSKVFPE